jgi:Zn-dependent protease
MSTESAADRRPPAPPPGGSGAAWTIFRFRGVPVRLDASLLLIVAFIVFSVYGQFSGLGPVGAVLSASVYAVMLFASILLHELGHAAASLERGIPVRGITLFALGGVTESTREARSARDEFIIVGIGPFVSLVLAAAFGLLGAVLEDGTVADALVRIVAMTNLLLAVFNLVPGYPLDGGRLLRSILWQVTGRPHQATRWAARVGQVFAVVLIADGVLPLVADIDLIPVFGGIFTAFIGLFLYRGAADAYKAAQFRERLSTRTARTMMGSLPPPLPPDATVAQARALVAARPSLLWPVGDPLVGAVTLRDLERVSDVEAGVVPVGRVATAPERVTVAADASLDDIVDRLAAAPDAMLLVVEHGGHPIGLLTPSLVTGAAQGGR